MTSFDYEVQGVPMTDSRWANDPRTPLDGCWHLLQGTSVLPRFPGLRATEYHRPGQHGEDQVQFAPLNPRTLELRVRFLPVDHDPASPTYQSQGRTWTERMRFLEQNINEFLFRTQLGATSSLGNLQIRRRATEFEHFPHLPQNRTNGWQTTTGRVLADVEPTLHEDALYADYTFLFTIPEGTWWTTWIVTSGTALAGRETAIDVPMGTAPVWDSMIALRPRSGTALPPGTKVLNVAGNGFEMSRDSTSSNWRVIGSYDYKMGHNGSNSPNWGSARNNASMVSSLGRPEGGALLITPGVAGSGERIGRVLITPTVNVDVMIRLYPRFF